MRSFTGNNYRQLSTRNGFGHSYLLFWIAGLLILIALTWPLIEEMKEERMSLTRGLSWIAVIWGLPVLFWMTAFYTEWRENRAFEKRQEEKRNQDPPQPSI